MSEEHFEDELEEHLPGKPRSPMARRFRGFLPVVIDVECGGFNCATDALLEIAAVTIGMDEQGLLYPQDTLFYRVEPFAGANIEPAALEFTGIDPFNPLRGAVDEKEALTEIFKGVRKGMKEQDCGRAIIVAHNATFDHCFVMAAAERAGASQATPRIPRVRQTSRAGTHRASSGPGTSRCRARRSTGSLGGPGAGLTTRRGHAAGRAWPGRCRAPRPGPAGR